MIEEVSGSRFVTSASISEPAVNIWVKLMRIGALMVAVLLPLQANALVIVSVDADPTTAGVQNVFSVEAGTSFDVDIVVEGLAPSDPPITGIEFLLSYASSTIGATGVVSGGFLPPGGAPLPPPLPPTLSPVSLFELNLYFGPLPPGSNQGATLATISFNALAPGVSNLTLGPVLLTSSFLPVFSIVNNASITVTGSAAPIPLPGTSFLVLVGLIGWRLSFYRRRA